jgi:hypothetical protein
MNSGLPYGFRILGSCHDERRLVDWDRAFAGYAACDPRAEVEREGYLSAFAFGDEFRNHLTMNGTTKGYTGPCWAQLLWFDIDRDNDLNAATGDARRLCAALAERYQTDGDALLIFFSGAKGFHIGLPTSLWRSEPSVDFHKSARYLAEQLAAFACVGIDTGVYDKVRAFRAPNSRHPKTGRHKRRLEFDELQYVTTAAIVERAAKPEPFDVPDDLPLCDIAVADWQQAVDAVRGQAAAIKQRRIDAGGTATLNWTTLEFIKDGALVGDRHRLLFSAAANLAEFGCPPNLAHALLTPSGEDCGLPPKEIRRQIDCGLSHRADAGQTTGACRG